MKVRLILSKILKINTAQIYFNSMKVRLILVGCVHGCGVIVFQFHEGSINTDFLLLPLLARSAFQFHEGSINTVLQRERQRQAYRFQFHEGSINTVAKLNFKYSDRNFNSMKVRLIRASSVYCVRMICISIP